MTTYRQLVFLLYGVITRCHSLSNLCKSLVFLDKRLSYLDIEYLPSKSTLSNANIKRNNDVFGALCHQLYAYYKPYLSSNHIRLFLDEQIHPDEVEVFDSSTISLFTDIFKEAGHKPLGGRKKGRLKNTYQTPLNRFCSRFDNHE